MSEAKRNEGQFDRLVMPPVLDACCGGRMFWWNKQNEHAYFADKREVDKGAFANGWNPNWCVKPDGVHDFTGKTGKTIWVTFMKVP